MLTQVIWLLVGLALLVKGGDLFVSAAVRIAEQFRIPRVVVGSTLVSLATTMPELVVSLMAGGRGESGLAMGNAIGSCICNVGLILGVTAAFRDVKVHPGSLRTPLLGMIGFAVLVFLMSFDLRVSRWQGAVLVVCGLAYFAFDFWQHARDTRPADAAEAKAVEEAVGRRFHWFEGKAESLVQFAVGAGIVVLGSRFLVDAAISLASGLGIPSIVIGLTVVAVGTSLPELVTAVTSSRKNVSDLAVGNVLGANIANLTFIVGAAAMMSEVTMSRATQLLNFPALLLVSYSLYLCAVVFLVAVLKK